MRTVLSVSLPEKMSKELDRVARKYRAQQERYR